LIAQRLSLGTPRQRAPWTNNQGKDNINSGPPQGLPARLRPISLCTDRNGCGQ
jgi:hypothetical protein